MIDIKLIRSHPEMILNSLKKRGTQVDLEKILQIDAEIRDTKHELEVKKRERNQISSQIGKGELAPEAKQEAILEIRKLGSEIKDGDELLRVIEARIHQLLLQIPNLLHKDTPIGTSKNDNVEVKKWKEPRNFNFEPKPHFVLAEELDIMDSPRGVKISKSRFTLLKGTGALLERALANFMLDVQTQENGYLEIIPPYLVNAASLTGTGQLPKFEEDTFRTTDGLYLIPTAEVPLTNIFRDEILQENQLPIHFAAWTPCFRSEVGSYGKDTKGYIRQHQFNKVELVKFTHPDHSLEALESLLENAECILRKLEIPFRTIALCSGDIGFAAGKCYDIEVWIPSEKKYREISSCSNTFDFQARRANIKFKPKKGGKPQFVHTLNGSGLAVGRTLVAVLENYQNEDGSIKIPDVLVTYLHGLTEVKI